MGVGDRAPVGRSIGLVQDPKLQIQMLHDRVMIRVTDGTGERRSSAGIVIPATAEVAKRLIWGEVFGVGQHVRTVKVGDRVLFGRDDQYEVEVQGRARDGPLPVTGSRPTRELIHDELINVEGRRHTHARAADVVRHGRVRRL